MPRDKREVEDGLLNKGFLPAKGDHNFLIYHSLAGKKTVVKTKTSHGKGFDIGDALLGEMARQCGVTRKAFLNLVDCPLQRPEYEKLLKAAGKL